MKTRIQNRYFGRKIGSLAGRTYIRPSQSKSALKNRREKTALQKNHQKWESDKWGQIIRNADGTYTASPTMIKKPVKPNGIMARIQKRKEFKLKRRT